MLHRISAGEGGAATTDNDDLAEKMRMVRTHGEKAKYASEMLGTNYRMTNLQAALGVAQLKKIDILINKNEE